MLESGKITPGQAGFLMIFTVLGTSNLVMPSLVSQYARMDAWISVVLATFPHIIIILVFAGIASTFPKESFVNYIRLIMGKYLGMITIVGYLWYLIYVEALVTRTVAEFLLTSFMPETPIEVFIIVMLLLGALVVKAGLEVLARAATFILPIFLVSFAVILLLLTGEINLSYLTPIFESGFKPVIHGSIYPALWQGEFVLMLFIWPYLNKPEQGLRSMVQAAVIILLVMLPVTMVSTSIFGPLTHFMRFPTFSLVEYIDLAGFITRLDSVFMAIWIAGSFIKIGILYYVICLTLSELLGLKEYQCTVYPVGIIIGTLVITVAPNMAVFASLFPRVVVPLNLLFEYILPGVFLALIYFRGFQKREKGENNGF